MYRWDKNKKVLLETKNKNQIICKQETIDKLIELYPEYKEKVHNYDWTTFPTPKEEKFETRDLHISGIPNDYSQSEAVEYVHKRLDRLLSRDNYKVNFELRERNGSGIIHGFGKITFNDNVDMYTRYLCKLILHNKMLLNKKGWKCMVSTLWHKDEQKAPVTKRKDFVKLVKQSDKPIISDGVKVLGW